MLGYRWCAVTLSSAVNASEALLEPTCIYSYTNPCLKEASIQLGLNRAFQRNKTPDPRMLHCLDAFYVTLSLRVYWVSIPSDNADF